MADARLTALRGLNEVFGQGGYSNLVLESLMRKNELTGQERAFCTALFYGVVERMEDTGSLLAMDLYPHRLKLVEDGAARLGLRCIQTKANDAQIYDKSLGVFDRILCDVVCSGYGVIRRKPEIRYKDPAEGVALPQTQLAILTTSARYLAPGGRLVYSTCTLNPAENEGVVNAFLRKHRELALCGEPVTCLPEQTGGDGFFYAVLEKKL